MGLKYDKPTRLRWLTIKTQSNGLGLQSNGAVGVIGDQAIDTPLL